MPPRMCLVVLCLIPLLQADDTITPEQIDVVLSYQTKVPSRTNLMRRGKSSNISHYCLMRCFAERQPYNLP